MKKKKKRTEYKYRALKQYSMSRESFGVIAMGAFGISIMFLFAGMIVVSI